MAPGVPEGYARVTLSTGFSAGLKKLSYYLVIQEVVTYVTDMLSCQGFTDIIPSLRFSALILASALSSGKEKQRIGAISHDCNLQTTGNVALSTRLLGKIPEYTEESLYLLSGTSKINFFHWGIFQSYFL